MEKMKLREIAELAKKARGTCPEYRLVRYEDVDLIILKRRLEASIETSHERTDNQEEKRAIERIAEKEGIKLRGLKK